jgi:GNAT superfamily N-acetyltransferase
MTVERIVPLAPEHWDALAALFAEGGDPRFCWCMYWRLRSSAFSGNRIADNRAGLRRLANEAAASGLPAPGLVALRGDRAVGWVSLGPRADFERLERSRTIPRLDDRPVWSVVCFAVSETSRGQRIAGKLLEAAIDYARRHGAPALEAYPAVTGSTRLPASAMYSGSLSLFEAAGFRRVADTTAHTGGAPRVVVHLEMG